MYFHVLWTILFTFFDNMAHAQVPTWVNLNNGNYFGLKATIRPQLLLTSRPLRQEGRTLPVNGLVHYDFHPQGQHDRIFMLLPLCAKFIINLHLSSRWMSPICGSFWDMYKTILNSAIDQLFDKFWVDVVWNANRAKKQVQRNKNILFCFTAKSLKTEWNKNILFLFHSQKMTA